MRLLLYHSCQSTFANYFNEDTKILIKLDNPISSDLDVMRPSILPNLLEVQ